MVEKVYRFDTIPACDGQSPSQPVGHVAA